MYVGYAGLISPAVITLSRDGRTITRVALTFSVVCGTPSYNVVYSELMTTTAIPVAPTGTSPTSFAGRETNLHNPDATLRHRMRLDGMVHGRDLVGWLGIESDVVGASGVVSETCLELETLDLRSSPGSSSAADVAGAPAIVRFSPGSVPGSGLTDVTVRVRAACRRPALLVTGVSDLPVRGARFRRRTASYRHRRS